MKAVIIKKEDYEHLPFALCDAIWEIAHRDYGFRMISRETKQEIDKDTMLGIVVDIIKKTLESAEEY